MALVLKTSTSQRSREFESHSACFYIFNNDIKDWDIQPIDFYKKLTYVRGIDSEKNNI
jgi:hypothetical protein